MLSGARLLWVHSLAEQWTPKPRDAADRVRRPDRVLHSAAGVYRSEESDGREERKAGCTRPGPKDGFGVDRGGAVSSLPLDQFGDFRLIRQLGEPGAFGAAYEALRNGERSVVKIFHGELVDRVALARFQREVKAQRRASHPNLVEYLDSGMTVWQGRRCHWISMQYLEGHTLRDELDAKGGRLDPARARSVASQVATGLVALHREGMVHRDLKPSNIFICTDGRVVILDFGIALFLDYTSLTERGRFVGTWGYAAPEQLVGDEVPATDLYSLGVVLYQAVAGRMPFTARVLLELINRIQNDDPEPPSSFCSELPASLEQLILWLLEKEAHRRPHDASHVAALLEGGTESVIAQMPQPYQQSTRPLLFIRAGRERDPLARACATICMPAAIVAPLTDLTARREARRVAGYANAGFAADPQTFRLSSASFALSARMSQLPFAPADGIRPYQADHFRELDEARRFAWSVVDEQVDAGATLLYGASFVIRSLDDPWLPRSAKLLEESVRRRDVTAAELPLYAPLAITIDTFATEEAQSRLVNKLSRANVDGYVLMFDQLTIDSPPALLVAAIRLALVLQQTGRPVVIGRAGALRHLFLAFGIAGVEVGLGRFSGFRLADFDARRPFATLGPRFEVPSLLASFTQEQAQRILAAGVIPETTCECPSCSQTKSVEDQLRRTVEHDAAMYERQCGTLDGVAPADRVAVLERAIDAALRYEGTLKKAAALKGRLDHLRIWSHAVSAARPFLDELRIGRRAA